MGGGFFRSVTRIAAPIIGVATGNPWLAAAAGAASGAASGGGIKGAIMGGLSSGLGGAVGGTLGRTAGSLIGSSSGAIGSMLGTGIGAYMAQSQINANPKVAMAEPPIVSVPTFNEMKQNAINQTEVAMNKEGIYNIVNENLTRSLGKYKNIYNRDKFTPIKDLLKKRKIKL